MTIEEKINFLCKPAITAKEIQSYVGCKKTTAYRIMKIAKEQFNGKAGIFTNSITPTSLCLCLGSTIENQLAILKAIKND